MRLSCQHAEKEIYSKILEPLYSIISKSIFAGGGSSRENVYDIEIHSNNRYVMLQLNTEKWKSFVLFTYSPLGDEELNQVREMRENSIHTICTNSFTRYIRIRADEVHYQAHVQCAKFLSSSSFCLHHHHLSTSQLACTENKYFISRIEHENMKNSGLRHQRNK